MINLQYATILGLSGFVSFMVAGGALKRRAMPGAAALAVLMYAVSLWTLGYAIFWLVPNSPGKFFWLCVIYLGVVITTPALLVMVAQLTGHLHWLTGRVRLAVAIPGMVILLALWSDPLFGYFFGRMDFTDPLHLLQGGPGFWLGVGYSYAGNLLAGLMLLQALVPASGVRREQLSAIILGASLPVLANLLSFLRLVPLPGLDLAPVVYPLSGVLYAFGLFSYRLKDLAPMGREAVVELLQEGVLVIDRQNLVVDANAQARKFVNAGAGDPVGRPVGEVFSDWIRESRLDLSLDSAAFQVKTGQEPGRWYDLTMTPLRDQAGLALGHLVLWRDVTEQKLVEQEFQKFYTAVEQSNASIVITDAASRIEYVNPFFSQVTGYDFESVRGQTPRLFQSGQTADETYASLWGSITRGQVWDGEMLNRKKNGELFWEHNRISPVRDEQGNITHYIAVKEDITERKQMDDELRLANLRLQSQLSEIERLHAQLQEEAIRDRLTGLFNRKFMEETLEREISMAVRNGNNLSLVIVDIDKFKEVNDTFGHLAGDTVIQTLGEFLRQNTRSGDIACRYGGDEIVVVMPNASLDDAFQRAEEWRAAFLGMKFFFDKKSYSTSLSLGVAVFPGQASSAFELLNAADKALYTAKTRRNTVCRFDPLTMKSPSRPSTRD